MNFLAEVNEWASYYSFVTISLWPASQALTVTQGSSDITLIPSSTEFKMAQVIKFPIKRWESVQGRGIERAHWLKPNESPQHTAGAAAALLTVTGTHHLSLISSSFDYCLHQPDSLWQLVPIRLSSAAVVENQSTETQLHESDNPILQDQGVQVNSRNSDSYFDHDTILHLHMLMIRW